MLARFRPRITYANVVATLALFIALGGGAYAAATINGSSLKDRSVPGKKLKQRAITQKELGVTFLRGKDRIPAGDLTGTYAAPHVRLPQVIRVKDNPLTPYADPCDQGQTAILCGSATQFGARAWFNWGPPFGPVGFWRDPYRLVHLTGEFKEGQSTDKTVFILPPGYRPGHVVQFSVARQDPNCSGPSCDGNYAVVQVAPDGHVTEPTGGNDASDGFSLEGITYPAG